MDSVSSRPHPALYTRINCASHNPAHQPQPKHELQLDSFFSRRDPGLELRDKLRQPAAAYGLGQGVNLYANPKPAPALPGAAELLSKAFNSECKYWLADFTNQKLPAPPWDESTSRSYEQLMRVLADNGPSTLPDAFRQPGFLVGAYGRAHEASQGAFARHGVKIACKHPGMAANGAELLNQTYGKHVQLSTLLPLPPGGLLELTGAMRAQGHGVVLRAMGRDHKAEFDKKLVCATPQDASAALAMAVNSPAFAEGYNVHDIRQYADKLKTAQGPQRDVLLTMLANVGLHHPDAGVKGEALRNVLDKLPPQSREALLRAVGPEAAASIQKVAAQQGGELGKMLAPHMVDGPLKQEDVGKLQQAVQKRFLDVLINCEDEDKLRSSLYQLDPAVRERLMSQFNDLKAELTTVKRLVQAKGLAENNRYQYNNHITIDGYKAEKKIAGLMQTPRLAALLSGLHKTSLERDCQDGVAKAQLQKQYLNSQNFRDKLKMLGTPGQAGLNAEQKKLLVENVARVSAFESDPAAQDRLMDDVAATLAQDPSLGLRPDPGAAAQVAAELETALKDPKLSPDEKNELKQLYDLSKDGWKTVKDSRDFYRKLRTAEKTLEHSVGALKCIKSGIKWMGPVGDLYGCVTDYQDVRKAIQEGDSSGAQLKVAALVTGGAAGAAGVMALCMASGPPGWVVAGLGALAAGVAVAAGIWSKDPWEETCRREGVLTSGRPPGPPWYHGWDRHGRIVHYTHPDVGRNWKD